MTTVRSPKKAEQGTENTRIFRVLGMDPSFRNWGFAYGSYVAHDDELQVTRVQLVTTERSSLKTVRRSSDDFRSAQELWVKLQEIVREYDPHVIFSEIPQGSQSATASRGLGIALGVLASVGRTLIQVQPLEVKNAVTGSKTASKADMMQAAHKLYPKAEGWLVRKTQGRLVLQNAAEHQADAVGALVAGIRTQQFQELRQIMLGSLFA